MILKRKVKIAIKKWIDSNSFDTLLIRGARQVGKTQSIRNFFNHNNIDFVEINFWKNPKYLEIFNESLEVKDIISKISFVFNKTITPNTYIFLDEIQECPNARRSLKFFKEDKTYHVIASGSLLGVNLSINKLTKDEPSSIAVGSEKHFVMKPLDFEEFLWNNNISEQDIELLRKYYLEKKRIPKIYFEKYFDLLNKYTIVGGMPEAVVEFLERNDLETVKSIHKKIMISYRDDIAKYATNDQKVKARNIYDSLTYQLSKENTKFKFSLIDKSAKIHKAEYLTAINWLKETGIIIAVNNLDDFTLPLHGNNTFKLYFNDIGLLLTSLEFDDFLNWKNKDIKFKGAITENLICQNLVMNHNLFYYAKNGYEIDFVNILNNKIHFYEVKTRNGKAKSLDFFIKHNKQKDNFNYIKFTNGNIGFSRYLTLPIFMCFLFG